MIGKVALDAPPATVTVAGNAATAALLLDSVTITPPATAGPDSATVPVEPFPPTKLLGYTEILSTAGGFTVSDDVLVTPKVAVIAVGVATDTGAVAIENITEVAPPGIFTVPGGTTAAVLLVRETETPPLGAGPVSVRVPEVLFPPIKAVATRANVETAGGFTVSCVDIPALW